MAVESGTCFVGAQRNSSTVTAIGVTDSLCHLYQHSQPLTPTCSSRSRRRAGSYRLDDYVTIATNDVAMQLGKAGVRLAAVLNQALR